MSDTLIHIEGLYKKFARSLKRSMIYGTADTFRSMAGISYNTSQLRKSEFWALEDINLELKRGETLGLIGANGSGKSTLLRLINGIFPPDLGKITINGRMGALIAVGAGFHPHMTGRENIFLNATILGMKKDEIRQKFDAIVDFAEIGEFIDAPVATYSSGMTVRLGFSIAIHAHIDILLVDEILAVGDFNFQKKCFDKINDLTKKDIGVILISHDIATIERMCSTGILLNNGKSTNKAPVREIIKEYIKILNDDKYVKIQQGANKDIITIGGVGNIEIQFVRTYQIDNKNISFIEFSKDFIIEFDYFFKIKNTAEFQLRVGIRNSYGVDIQKFFVHEKGYKDNVMYINEVIKLLPMKGKVKLLVKKPKLMPGIYIIDIAIQSINSGVSEGGYSNISKFQIIEPQSPPMYFEYAYKPIVAFDHSFEITEL